MFWPCTLKQFMNDQKNKLSTNRRCDQEIGFRSRESLLAPFYARARARACVCMQTYNDGIKEDLIGGVSSTDGNNRTAFGVFGWKRPNEN